MDRGSGTGTPDPSCGVTFVDPSLLPGFARDGFVVIDDMLEPPHLAELADTWRAISLQSPPVCDPTGLSATIRHPEIAYSADAAISPLIARALHRHLTSHVPFMSAFLVKAPDAGELPPHLDWSLIDESVAPTLGCWIPLEDVDEFNGALGVIPGSHRLVDFERTPEEPGHEWVDRATSDMQRVVLRVRSGSAVIYDHRLVHFSPAPGSARERVATNSGLAPPAAAAAARANLMDMMARGMSGDGSSSQIPEHPS